jgi:hypothetical protein
VRLGINISVSRQNGGFGPASLFSAGQIGGWYDPSDINTLFQDSAGTTPVTAAGQPVGRILDKSGRGNHATQATAGSRPTYQIDGTGRPYLSFDGVDDFLVTPTITPGTDKSQVFVGLRKLSDAATGIVVETSTNFNSFSGVVAIQAPSGALARYAFTSRGTAIATAVTLSVYAAPITNVLTGIGDIAADTSILRVNGVQAASVTTDQGTGNYLAYPMYIGRRAGTLLPFNGYLYSLIVRFGPNLAAGTISETETWMNGKTGAY